MAGIVLTEPGVLDHVELEGELETTLGPVNALGTLKVTPEQEGTITLIEV